MSLLKISGANYSYPQSQKNALENINLSVEKGDYIALVGTNGSGKSTLARMMAGFFEPKSGSVELEKDVLPGIVFQQPKDQIVAGIVERDTAFGPQNLNISKSEIELRTIECLSVVGLADRAMSRTFELSLGQTQRLAFSGILALFPDFLILDEVTSMLDPHSRNEIIQFVDEWNAKGHTIIHITHDLSETLHAKRVVALENGSIIFDGTKDIFMQSPQFLNKVFCDESYLYERSSLLSKKKSQNQEIALEAKNISFSWEDRKVFENLNFSLKKGSLTALTGPSGCGKSTFFECLAGLQNLKSGSIYAISRPALALQETEAALFENYAADDVAFGPKNSGVNGKNLLLRVKNAMEMAGLPYKKYADSATFKLSGGEKRKLSLAGIIALDSDIMIFDEPTAALDSYSKKTVLQSLRKLADEGKTVLFSTHRMEEADIADFQLKWEDLTSENAKNLCKEEQKSNTENQLKKQDVLENAKILKVLNRASRIFISPAKLPSSPVSLLPPVLKSLLFLSIFIASIAVKSWQLCTVLFAVNIIYGIFALYPPKKFFAATKALLPWLFIFAVIEMFFEIEGNILFQWKFIVITDTKLELIAKIFLRAFCIILSLGVFLHTTNERQLLDGLAALLKPLALIKIPVRYAVLVAGIIFRFIPLLMEELSGIIKTQIVRGTFGKAKGLSRLKILVPLLVPLLVQSFRKAERLSEALTARYFE